VKVVAVCDGYSAVNDSLLERRLRLWLNVGCTLVALESLAARALAQSSAPESSAPPALVLPELRHDPGVSYPTAALERGVDEPVTVQLVLELSPEGTVEKASVDGPPRPPFDTSALAAAHQLRFTPALRGGVPVRARIRFRYVFEPPPPILSGRIVDDGTGLPLSDATVIARTADGTELRLRPGPDSTFRNLELPRGSLELTIHAPGRESQRAEVVLAPGRETHVEVRLARVPDPSNEPAPRAASPQALEVVVHGERLAPAVTSFSRAEVREMPGAFGDPFRAIEALPGVTPIGSGLPYFYVRGAPPGNVGYFLNGVRVPYLFHVAIGPSVIHPGLVERVDLYSGGYPARFGRFAGGIVSAETTTPRADLHGEANVRLFDAGALVETGFADGRGTLLLGGRYSYTALLFSILVPDLKLDYRDYQARVTYDLGDRDRLSVFGFGAYDLLAQEQQHGLNVLFGTEFYRLDLAHEHTFDSGTLRTGVTLGYDQTHQDDEGNAIDRSIAARTELRHAFTTRTLLRAGADVRLDHYTTATPKHVDPEDPEVVAFARANPGRTDRSAGVYGDLVLDVANGIEVTPGIRVDWYQSQSSDAVAVEPRLAARFRVSNRLTLVHAFGLAQQPPAFALSLPGRNPAGLRGGLQKSLQTSAGAELTLDRATKLTTTLFYNAFFDMADVLSAQGDGPPDARPVERSVGSGVGLEVHLNRRLTERLGGFLSYTLSRSMRSLGREKFPSSFDRTHVLNAAVAYDLGRAWRAGTRLVFYTGAPKPGAAEGLITPQRTPHPKRSSPFYRVDLRLEKRWNLGESTWISFIFEALNATLSKETFGDTEVGPITLPSLGAELGF
jgi:TonB family protein